MTSQGRNGRDGGSQSPHLAAGQSCVQGTSSHWPRRGVGVADEDVADMFPDGLGVWRKRRITFLELKV